MVEELGSEYDPEDELDDPVEDDPEDDDEATPSDAEPTEAMSLDTDMSGVLELQGDE